MQTSFCDTAVEKSTFIYCSSAEQTCIFFQKPIIFPGVFFKMHIALKILPTVPLDYTVELSVICIFVHVFLIAAFFSLPREE
jgi:hypothetical protein